MQFGVVKGSAMWCDGCGVGIHDKNPADTPIV